MKNLNLVGNEDCQHELANSIIRQLDNSSTKMTQHRHFIIHKPYGYLSQFKLGGNAKKKLLGELHDFPDGTMSIGRLDKHSEGLLLLTTNGKVSALVNGHKVEKEYYAQVDGEIDDVAIMKMKNGLELSVNGEKYITKDCKVEKIKNPGFPERSRRIRAERHGPTSWVSIVLREGKFRQVRKMTAKVGFPTLRLIRVRVGKIKLNTMISGEVIEVDNFELK